MNHSGFAHVLFGWVGEKHGQIRVGSKASSADAHESAHTDVFSGSGLFDLSTLIVEASQLQG